MSLERQTVSSFIRLLSWIQAWLKTPFFWEMPVFTKVCDITSKLYPKEQQPRKVTVTVLFGTDSKHLNEMSSRPFSWTCQWAMFRLKFSNIFFFFRKGSPSSTAEKRQNLQEGLLRVCKSWLLSFCGIKSPPQTGKLFLAKIMSISGTGNTLHFFFISTLVLSKPFPIFSIPKSVNWTHWALKYL